MKKIIVIILIAATSQISFAQSVKIGPKIGANMVKISGQSFDDQFNLGYYAGGFVQVKLNDKWYIQPEILFNEMKFRRTNNFASLYNNLLQPDSLKNINLQYLSIPVLAGYKVANILAIEAGVQYGIKMNNHQTLLQNGKEAFKSGDFSLLAGAQFSFSKLRVSARYAIGLNDLNDIDSRDKWKTQTIQIGVGIVL